METSDTFTKAEMDLAYQALEDFANEMNREDGR